MFDEFIEKFIVYLTANMNGAKDVVKTIVESDDTLKRIDKDEPKDLRAEESASVVKVLLKTEEVKKFGNRRQLAKENLVKIYGLIWGSVQLGCKQA